MAAEKKLSPNQVRAFRALEEAGERGLTKSELASAVWGAVSPSTQSMATRMTSELTALAEARKIPGFRGTIDEERRGRLVFVRANGLSAREAQSARNHDQPFDVLDEAAWTPAPTRGARRTPKAKARSDAPNAAESPLDRPYAHLIDVAKVTAAHLDPESPLDAVFARILLRILDKHPDDLSDAREDARAIRDLSSDFRDPRRKLALALTTFVHEHERDFMADELIAAFADLPDQGSTEILVWVAMAVTVARRLFILGGDRAMEDRGRLLRRARKVLKGPVAEKAPVHAAYFQGISRITSGKLDASAWGPLVLQKKSAPVLASKKGSKLAESILEDERRLVLVGMFNTRLSRFDAHLQQWLRPEVDRTLGFSSIYAHDQGAPVHQAAEWARDHRRRLRAALHRARNEMKEHSHEVLTRFRESANDDELSSVITSTGRYQIAQARYLLGEDLSTEEPAHDPDAASSEREYDRLIRNNYWTPGQLWTDIAIHEDS